MRPPHSKEGPGGPRGSSQGCHPHQELQGPVSPLGLYTNVWRECVCVIVCVVEVGVCVSRAKKGADFDGFSEPFLRPEGMSKVGTCGVQRIQPAGPGPLSRPQRGVRALLQTSGKKTPGQLCAQVSL